MLTNLLIKNYALIQQLELTPSPSLNIITGETGAGKSIMLGALGLLLGNRADSKALFYPSEKCIVEGLFDVEGYGLEPLFEDSELDYSRQCIIRREILPSGKSRAFINDTPVTLDTQRRIGHRLMDIHSQHDTLLLGDSDFQLDLVDILANNQEKKNSYRDVYSRYKIAFTTLEKLKAEAQKLKKDYDYYSFLFNEIDSLALTSGEQETLEAELTILENTSELAEKFNQAHYLLDNPEHSVLEMLKMVVTTLSQTAKIAADYQPLAARAQEYYLELKDLNQEVLGSVDDLESNPERETIVKERLDKIYALQQKHQVTTIGDLIALRDQYEEKIEKTSNIDEAIEKAERRLANLLAELNTKAEALRKTRLKVIPSIEKEVVSLLVSLGMPDARLSIDLQPTTLSNNGADAIKFLFSANKGTALQELKNVASGGEFSRMMLAFKYIMAGKTKLPTIIFDEIDTGISGEVAVRVGKMIQHMTKNHQVLVITHLPQIAAQGDRHYFVYKDNSGEKTVSRIRTLTLEERVYEVASMIGGQTPTQSLLENTRELMEQYRIN